MSGNYTGAAMGESHSNPFNENDERLSLLRTRKGLALLDSALIIRHYGIAPFPSQNHLSA